jgi:hypothetical protein
MKPHSPRPRGVNQNSVPGFDCGNVYQTLPCGETPVVLHAPTTFELLKPAGVQSDCDSLVETRHKSSRMPGAIALRRQNRSDER